MVGNGGGKRQVIAPGNPFDAGSNMGKRVRLTRKTRPGVSSISIPDPGHPNAEEMEKIAPSPFPPKEWGARRACFAIFFFDLGLGDFLLWGRLEPAFGGNMRRFFSGWSVQPKGLVHLAPVRFN